jgi:hypothetical protein
LNICVMREKKTDENISLGKTSKCMNGDSSNR